jgi:hypothetical protein
MKQAYRESLFSGHLDQAEFCCLLAIFRGGAIIGIVVLSAIMQHMLWSWSMLMSFRVPKQQWFGATSITTTSQLIILSVSSKR